MCWVSGISSGSKTKSKNMLIGKMFYEMLEHHISKMCLLHNNDLGAEQMCNNHICLEPAPDLEEEAYGLCI